MFFYDRFWKSRYQRCDEVDCIHEITGVPRDILRYDPDLVYETPVAVRMSWASRRRATREEDMAYCLMGLFDINMPMLYGEGRMKAFIRLQEEIIHQTSDLSIFAWTSPPNSIRENWYSKLRAQSPLFFSGSGNLEAFPDILYVVGCDKPTRSI